MSITYTRTLLAVLLPALTGAGIRIRWRLDWRHPAIKTLVDNTERMVSDIDPPVDDLLLTQERHIALRAAFARLPGLR